MTQYARPDADDYNGDGWTYSEGSTLFGCVDEVSADDGDYIDSPSGSPNYCELGLSSVNDPESSSDHVIRARAKRLTGGATGTAVLYEGASPIATLTLTLGSGYATATYTLTSGEANSIGNYGNLSIRLNQTANNKAISVSWVEFAVPDAVVLVTFAGTIGAVSNIPDAPFKRLREFVSVAVTGVSGVADAPLKILKEFVSVAVGAVSNIPDVPLKRIREFVSVAVGGISGVLGDITVTGAGVVQALAGSIAAVSGIADAPFKRIRGFVSVAVAGVSQVSVVFKRIRRFMGSLSGWESFDGWSMSHPSSPQHNFEWSMGTPGGEYSYGQPKSSVSGTLKRVKLLIGSVASASGVTGLFTGTFNFIGTTVQGVSSIVSDLSKAGIQLLQGAVGGVSGVVGNFTGTFNFSGSAGGVSGVDGVLKRIRKFVGNIFGTNLLTDGGLNIWTTPTNLTNWVEAVSGSSTINREASEVHEGQYSVRGDVVSGSSNAIEQTNTLENLRRYEVRFWAKVPDPDRVWYRIIAEGAPDLYYDWATGDWATSGGYAYADGGDTEEWQEIVNTFVAHPTRTQHTLRFNRAGGSSDWSWYVDDVWLVATASKVTGALGRIRKFVSVAVGGISGVIGDITVTAEGVVKALAGSIAALSDVLGNITGTFTFLGSVGAVSNIADATFKRIRKLVGVSIDAVSSIATASIKILRKFIGNIGSASGVDAVLKRIRRFTAPAIQGISSIIAPLTKGAEVLLQGVIGAVSSVNANILVDYVLSGVVGAVSGVTSSLGRVRTFIGNIGSVSGVDAVLKRLRRFVGVSIDGVSFVLGDIQKGAIQLLQGTIGALSDVVGAIRGTFTFSGSIGGVSGVSGVLKVVYKFIGVTVQGVSSITAVMSTLGTVILRATVGAVSDVLGSLKTTKAFIGSVSSLSAVSGVLRVVKQFIGTVVSGVSGVTGVLKRGRVFVGEVVSGVSSVDGFIKITKKFVAIPVAAVSSVTGVMSWLGVIILRGTIGAISGIDASLKATFSLKGTTDGLSGATGSMRYTASFSGLVAAVSDLTGTILTSATIVFQGVVSSISAVDGVFKRLRGFVATIDGVSGVDVVMKRIRAYIVSVGAVSGATGLLKRLRRVSGSVAGSSAVDGYVKILKRFIGSITSGSVITAPLGRIKQFVGATISAVSSVTADLWTGVLYIYPIIFKVIPRERIKHTVARTREFVVEARKRIFKSDIEEDR
jgi:hypothetical protein